MPKSIVVDLNVILDVLLERTNFEAARDVVEAGEQGTYRLCISAHVVTTFAYLLEASKVPKAEILRQVGWLLQGFTVVAIDDALLKAALGSQIADYEDAVIESAAKVCGASAIITRNVKDFTRSAIRAVTPEAFLASL